MASKRRQFSADFKFRVAVAAVWEVNTVSELASQHDVHPTLIRKWKQQLLQDGAQVFAQSKGKDQREHSVRESELYEQIGQLKMELEWLKKCSCWLLSSSASDSVRQLADNDDAGHPIPEER